MSRNEVVEVWGRLGCLACTQAKELLESKGYAVSYTIVSPDNLETFMTKFNSPRSVPQILFSNGDIAPSLDSLKQILNKE